jgi:hypothetical protein
MTFSAKVTALLTILLLAHGAASAAHRGRATLRRLQWQRADAGNLTMLIWLGTRFC